MTLDVRTLDELSDRSLAGDASAEAALFDALRVRFLALAKRRVQNDHVEDVVQDSLKIVFDRYGERKQGTGILVWGLTVLRNVIGNHYQARNRERERLDFVEDYPAEASENPDLLGDTILGQTASELEEAISELASRYPRCGKIFNNLLASLERGGSPNQISSRALAAIQKDHPEMTAGGFYTALHRCRANLRLIWDRRQEGTSHV